MLCLLFTTNTSLYLQFYIKSKYFTQVYDYTCRHLVINKHDIQIRRSTDYLRKF